jgi:hypothetical protein
MESQITLKNEENASQAKTIQSLNKTIEEHTIELRMKEQMVRSTLESYEPNHSLKILR